MCGRYYRTRQAGDRGTVSRRGSGCEARHVQCSGRRLAAKLGVDDQQIVSKPKWLEDGLVDVTAKPEDGVALTRDEFKPRLQNLLQQRFNLATYREVMLVRGSAVIQVQPRSFDVWGVHQTAELVRDARQINESLRALAVLNRADSQGKDNEAAADALRSNPI